jgi:G2/mitotic-specific cyclin 2
LGGSEEVTEGAIRKALQSKKTGNTTLGAAQAQRKRAALGDLSNVAKNDMLDQTKDGKKPQIKASVTTKPSQTAGVQKPQRASSARSALTSKDANKKTASSELKRPASGSGVIGGAAKKRQTVSTASKESIKEESPAAEDDVKNVTVEVQEHIQVEKTAVITIEGDRDLNNLGHDLEDMVPDLDADDYEDPLMVAEYAAEIFDYLRALEEGSMPAEDYMDHQEHIEWADRDILNDWLVQVHQRFQLLPETFYLAINIIDRFLSNKIVQLDKLQLVGITALFIASKYEEVISPHVSNFTYMAKDYQDTEILSAERFILSTLDYDLSYPNPMNFLRRISKADNYDIQTRTLGKYLLEISLLDHRFLKYHPSHISAAAMYMSRMILERGEWVGAKYQPKISANSRKNSVIAHYAGYTEEEIQPVFDLLLDYCSGEIRHDAFHAKYASKKYLKGTLTRHFHLSTVLTSQQLLSSSASGLSATSPSSNGVALPPAKPGGRPYHPATVVRVLADSYSGFHAASPTKAFRAVLRIHKQQWRLHERKDWTLSPSYEHESQNGS